MVVEDTVVNQVKGNCVVVKVEQAGDVGGEGTARTMWHMSNTYHTGLLKGLLEAVTSTLS